MKTPVLLILSALAVLALVWYVRRALFAPFPAVRVDDDGRGRITDES